MSITAIYLTFGEITVIGSLKSKQSSWWLEGFIWNCRCFISKRSRWSTFLQSKKHLSTICCFCTQYSQIQHDSQGHKQAFCFMDFINVILKLISEQAGSKHIWICTLNNEAQWGINNERFYLIHFMNILVVDFFIFLFHKSNILTSVFQKSKVQR